MNQTIINYNKRNNIAEVNSVRKIREVLAGTVPEICRAPGGNLHIKWQYDFMAEHLQIEPDDIRICDIMNRKPVYMQDLYDCCRAALNVRVNDICLEGGSR